VLEDDAAGNSWQFISYIWNATQDETIVINAGQQDANGTTHDVPSKGNCKDCHESQPGRVLGFQAIQLDDNSLPVNLEDLISDGTLTDPPTTGTAGARFPLPGAAVDKTALSYLHVKLRHLPQPGVDDPRHGRDRAAARGSASSRPSRPRRRSRPR
jgi:hypothetical protein